jgi:hypothetical protein
MADDPVVEEIHRIREKLLEEHGGLEGYLDHVKEVEKGLKDRLVTRPSRPPVITRRKIS